jgi:uncharacterized membrane protein YfcA
MILLVGIAAGMMTTVAGFGGGMMLVAVLAWTRDPLTALSLSSLALWVGNANRLFLFRHGIQLRFALPILAGVVPGVLIGNAVALHTPAWILHIAIVAVTLFSVAQALLKPSFALPRKLVTPLASGVGFLSATSGGGGFLLGPILLSSGARDALYLSTGALAGVSIHALRIAGYTSAGLVTAERLQEAALLAAAIVAGNLLGRSLRTRLSQTSVRYCELGAPLICAAAALIGL